jgi:hypothetical protein
MTPDAIRDHVRGLTAAQLDDLITGRTRVGDTPEEQLTAWNAAIDEETDRLTR